MRGAIDGAVFAGDANWIERDGDLPVPAGWADAWVLGNAAAAPAAVGAATGGGAAAAGAAPAGYTYDCKLNGMLVGGTYRERIDRVVFRAAAGDGEGMRLVACSMVGTAPLIGSQVRAMPAGRGAEAHEADDDGAGDARDTSGGAGGGVGDAATSAGDGGGEVAMTAEEGGGGAATAAAGAAAPVEASPAGADAAAAAVTSTASSGGRVVRRMRTRIPGGPKPVPIFVSDHFGILASFELMCVAAR